MFSQLQTVVLLHTWIAGLDDKNFKDGAKWIPERWLESTSPHSPLLVAPFGSGRRICPGKRFVEQALQLIVAKVQYLRKIGTSNKIKNKLFLSAIL